MTNQLDPTVRGEQHAGPARWARAKQWAELHPTSKAGRTYFERVATAERVAGNLPAQAWHHYRRGRKGQAGHDYLGQTCSTRCAMLELQVKSGATGFEALSAYVAKDGTPPYFVAERPADSTRKGKCLVCRSDVV